MSSPQNTEKLQSSALIRRCPSCGQGFPAGTDKCPEDGSMLGPSDPLVGTSIDNRYQIKEVVGQGGFSKVYKAWQESLHRFVAIKLLHAHLTQNSESLGRFQLEAQAAGTLSHPNVCSIHDYGMLANGQPYIVMDYLEGVSLYQHLQKNGPVSEAEAVSIFIQVCDGLSSAHEKGILHRDLKPSNILLLNELGDASTSSDRLRSVKILDFGLAKMLAGSDTPNELTMDGQTIGTPAYMSPEQCMGKKLTASSDIYSLGCSMYEAVTGRKVAPAENVFECMHLQVYAEPEPIAEVRPELKTTMLEAIIAKALQKDPEFRYKTAQEVRDDLALVLQKDTTRNKKIKALKAQNWQARLAKQLKNQRLDLIPLLIVACIGLLVYAFSLKSTPPPAPAVPSAPVSHEALRLDLSMGNVTDSTLPFRLEECKNLSDVTSLQLDTNYITDKSMILLNRLPNLTRLSLGQTAVTGRGFFLLHNPQRLQALGMPYSSLTDNGMEGIGRLTGLETLSLKCTGIHGSGLRHLAGLNKLNSLDIWFAKLTDNGLLHLPKLPALTQLTVSGNFLTDKGLARLCELPTLQSLNVNSTGITDSFVPKLSSSLPNLKHLEIADTEITDASLIALAKHPHLEFLDVSRTHISGLGLDALKSSPSLKLLKMKGCPGVTRQAVKDLQTAKRGIIIDND